MLLRLGLGLECHFKLSPDPSSKSLKFVSISIHSWFAIRPRKTNKPASPNVVYTLIEPRMSLSTTSNPKRTRRGLFHQVRVTLCSLIFASGSQAFAAAIPEISTNQKLPKETSPFASDPAQTLERTCFQTGKEWTPQGNLRSDVAIAYGIDAGLPQRIESWREHGYRLHVMTGVAWGQYQDYLYGRFDGTNHEDEAQT